MRTKKRKPQQDPEVLCGLCKHTEMIWLASEAPPQVIFDTLCCLVTNLVSESVVYEQRQSALDYIYKAAKDMIQVRHSGRKGLN
jgi:hypothetical protein